MPGFNPPEVLLVTFKSPFGLPQIEVYIDRYATANWLDRLQELFDYEHGIDSERIVEVFEYKKDYETN